jgi:hypothetical protein
MRKDQIKPVNKIYFQTIYFNIYLKANISIRISNLLIYLFFSSFSSMFIGKHLNFCCHILSARVLPLLLLLLLLHLLETNSSFCFILKYKKKRGRPYAYVIYMSKYFYTHIRNKKHIDIDLIAVIRHFRFLFFISQQLEKILLQDKFPYH